MTTIFQKFYKYFSFVYFLYLVWPFLFLLIAGILAAFLWLGMGGLSVITSEEFSLDFIKNRNLYITSSLVIVYTIFCSSLLFGMVRLKKWSLILLYISLGVRAYYIMIGDLSFSKFDMVIMGIALMLAIIGTAKKGELT